MTNQEWELCPICCEGPVMFPKGHKQQCHSDWIFELIESHNGVFTTVYNGKQGIGIGCCSMFHPDGTIPEYIIRATKDHLGLYAAGHTEAEALTNAQEKARQTESN